MSDKKTFVMYKSWSGAIERMTDEQAGQLLKAVYAIENGGTADPEDAALNLLWPVIKEKLEEDIDAYDTIIDQRKEAARKGNEKRWGVSQKSQERKTESQTSQVRDLRSQKSQERKTVSQKVANVAESVSESVSESVNTPPIIPPYGGDAGLDADWDGIREEFRDPEMGEAFCQWLKVRTAMPPFPYPAMTGAISDAKKAEDKYGAGKCTPLIRRARSGAWKAIPWETLEEKPTARSGTKKGSFGDFPQHEYDFDEIERALE